jgi:phage baseplate assembly protein W
MATFIGFNTIDQFKKFTLVDAELVKRDFVNALNIREGELPGRPGYGTKIWNFIFTNQTPETEQAMISELQRVAAQDPRLFLSNAEFYPYQNGMRVEIEVQIVPSTSAERLAVFFDQQSQRAQLTV